MNNYCSFCRTNGGTKFTSIASYEMAYMMLILPTQEKALEIHTSNFKSIRIPVKYCPVCGRDLSIVPVRKTEQEYSNIIRLKIKELVTKTGITCSQLAEDTGISKSTLSDFFSGKIACLTAGKIAVIADVLDIDMTDLLY